MAESFTDKMIELYYKESHKREIKITKKLDKQKEHVLVAESSEGKFKSQLFGGKAKGVHHFYGAVFTGILKESNYAWNGEKIRLDVPRGLYDGAPVTFSWKWTKDAANIANRPEVTFGRIQLRAGTPTKFGVTSRKAAGGWEAYDFWGEINSTNKITATTRISGKDINIVFTRLSGT